MPLNPDYGSTQPFKDPYTDAQKMYVELGLEAAKRANALADATNSWTFAFAATQRSALHEAHEYHADALAALHAYPTLRDDVLGTVRPIIADRGDAIAVLKQARALLERVRDSAILPDQQRYQRMQAALACIEKDLTELEADR